MGVASDQLDGLLHLLKASSKKCVYEICSEVASGMHRSSDANSLHLIQSQLSIGFSEAAQLLDSLTRLLHDVIYAGVVDQDSIHNLFPPHFHADLRDLLTKVLIEGNPRWRKLIIENQVGLPKLTEFSWKVKQTHNMAPSCVLNIKTSDKSTSNVEMSKETLVTMLNSLSKIREQISSIAQ